MHKKFLRFFNNLFFITFLACQINLINISFINSSALSSQPEEPVEEGLISPKSRTPIKSDSQDLQDSKKSKSNSKDSSKDNKDKDCCPQPIPTILCPMPKDRVYKQNIVVPRPCPKTICYKEHRSCRGCYPRYSSIRTQPIRTICARPAMCCPQPPVYCRAKPSCCPKIRCCRPKPPCCPRPKPTCPKQLCIPACPVQDIQPLKCPCPEETKNKDANKEKKGNNSKTSNKQSLATRKITKSELENS